MWLVHRNTTSGIERLEARTVLTALLDYVMVGSAHESDSHISSLVDLASSPTVVISEFSGHDDHHLFDGEGNGSDWVKLTNVDSQVVDLTGWFLTDDVSEPHKWRIPTIRLGAGESTIFFASGANRTGLGPFYEHHTNFRIDSTGEFLALIRPDGTTSDRFDPKLEGLQPPLVARHKPIQFSPDANNATVQTRSAIPKFVPPVVAAAAEGESIAEPDAIADRETVTADGGPRTWVINSNYLRLAKQMAQLGDPELNLHIYGPGGVVPRAKLDLDMEPISVTFKHDLPPDGLGDKHDFLNYGFYFHPNPDTEDGTPWMFIDGVANQGSRIDSRKILALRDSVLQLSLAYYFTEDERFASKAASLLRTFFVDSETRMRPRCKYSQIIPPETEGVCEVVGFGLTLPKILDASGILESSDHWTPQDQAALRQWVRDLIEWTDQSENRKYTDHDRRDKGNHGTSYDLLFTLFALFTEDYDRAKSHFVTYVNNRLHFQVDHEGKNLREINRANSLQYQRVNLDRAMDIAALGRHLDIEAELSGAKDLFHYTFDGNRGLRLQIDFITPYILGEQKWPHFPGGEDAFPVEPPWYPFNVLRRAAAHYQDPSLLERADNMDYRAGAFRVRLTHPRAVLADFDESGSLTASDLDTLAAAVRNGSNDSAHDLDVDGNVDRADFTKWIDDFYRTHPGDTDLDCDVDFDDFAALASNFPHAGGWSQGDNTGDGYVTIADFQSLARNFGRTTKCKGLP